MKLVTLNGNLAIVQRHRTPDRPIGDGMRLIDVHFVLVTPQGKLFKGMASGSWIVPQTNFFDAEVALHPSKVVELPQARFGHGNVFRYQVGDEYLRRDQVKYVDKDLNPTRPVMDSIEYAHEEALEISSKYDFSETTSLIENLISEKINSGTKPFFSYSHLDLREFLPGSDPSVPTAYYAELFTKKNQTINGMTVNLNPHTRKIDIYGNMPQSA